MSREYVFVDEWDVDAPTEAVFDALADPGNALEWWRPVYVSVEVDGPPAVGRVFRQRFKSRPTYGLTMESTITRLEPPRLLEIMAAPDLTGWSMARAREGLEPYARQR